MKGSWGTELTAWAAGLVLIAGVVTTFSMSGAQPALAPVAEDVTPVVQYRETVTRVAITPSPGPVARSSATTALAPAPALGPPPGPQYDAPPAATAAPQDRYAFLAGITNYRAPTHNTIGAVHDVRLIAGMLTDRGWLAQNIRIVTDEQATGAAIRAGLAWLQSKSTPGTFTFFHYSGHVKQVGSTVKLWPVDRDFLPDTEVAALLRGGTGKLWVDIAGCESGGFQGDLPSSRVLFTASSLESQKSYEYPDWGTSVWSGLLFDLGIRQGAADADRNGSVTIGEAIRYAAYYAKAITFGQRPYGPQTPISAGDPVRGWTLDAPPA